MSLRRVLFVVLACNALGLGPCAVGGISLAANEVALPSSVVAGWQKLANADVVLTGKWHTSFVRKNEGTTLWFARRGPLIMVEQVKADEGDAPRTERYLHNLNGTFAIRNQDSRWTLLRAEKPEIGLSPYDLATSLTQPGFKLAVIPLLDLADSGSYKCTKWDTTPDGLAIGRFVLQSNPARPQRLDGEVLSEPFAEEIEVVCDPKNNYRPVRADLFRGPKEKFISVHHIEYEYSDPELSQTIPTSMSFELKLLEGDNVVGGATNRLVDYTSNAPPASEFELEHYGLKTPRRKSSNFFLLGNIIAAIGFVAIALALAYRRRINSAEKSSDSNRKGFTVVELMVVIAVIGLLIALTGPAVQEAREASRRVVCFNNLRQSTIAWTLHEESHRLYPNSGGYKTGSGATSTAGQFFVPHSVIPPSTIAYGVGDPSRSPRDQTGSQFYAILPFADLATNFETVAFKSTVPIYLCPSRNRPGSQSTKDDAYGHYESGGWAWAKCDYATSGFLARANWHQRMKRPADLSDGLSNTIAFGEKFFVSHDDSATSWYFDEPFFLGGFAIHTASDAHLFRDGAAEYPSLKWSSAHKAGVVFSYADASVRLLPYSINEDVLCNLLFPAGPVTSDTYFFARAQYMGPYIPNPDGPSWATQ